MPGGGQSICHIYSEIAPFCGDCFPIIPPPAEPLQAGGADGKIFCFRLFFALFCLYNKDEPTSWFI